MFCIALLCLFLGFLLDIRWSYFCIMWICWIWCIWSFLFIIHRDLDVILSINSGNIFTSEFETNYSPSKWLTIFWDWQTHNVSISYGELGALPITTAGIYNFGLKIYSGDSNIFLFLLSLSTEFSNPTLCNL